MASCFYRDILALALLASSSDVILRFSYKDVTTFYKPTSFLFIFPCAMDLTSYYFWRGNKGLIATVLVSCNYLVGLFLLSSSSISLCLRDISVEYFRRPSRCLSPFYANKSLNDLCSWFVLSFHSFHGDPNAFQQAESSIACGRSLLHYSIKLLH